MRIYFHKSSIYFVLIYLWSSRFLGVFPNPITDCLKLTDEIISSSKSYNKMMGNFRENWKSPFNYLVQRGYIPAEDAALSKMSRDTIQKMQKEYAADDAESISANDNFDIDTFILENTNMLEKNGDVESLVGRNDADESVIVPRNPKDYLKDNKVGIKPENVLQDSKAAVKGSFVHQNAKDNRRSPRLSSSDAFKRDIRKDGLKFLLEDQNAKDFRNADRDCLRDQNRMNMPMDSIEFRKISNFDSLGFENAKDIRRKTATKRKSENDADANAIADADVSKLVSQNAKETENETGKEAPKNVTSEDVKEIVKTAMKIVESPEKSNLKLDESVPADIAKLENCPTKPPEAKPACTTPKDSDCEEYYEDVTECYYYEDDGSKTMVTTAAPTDAAPPPPSQDTCGPAPAPPSPPPPPPEEEPPPPPPPPSEMQTECGPEAATETPTTVAPSTPTSDNCKVNLVKDVLGLPQLFKFFDTNANAKEKKDNEKSGVSKDQIASDLARKIADSTVKKYSNKALSMALELPNAKDKAKRSENEGASVKKTSFSNLNIPFVYTSPFDWLPYKSPADQRRGPWRYDDKPYFKVPYQKWRPINLKLNEPKSNAQVQAKRPSPLKTPMQHSLHPDHPHPPQPKDKLPPQQQQQQQQQRIVQKLFVHRQGDQQEDLPTSADAKRLPELANKIEILKKKQKDPFYASAEAFNPNSYDKEKDDSVMKLFRQVFNPASTAKEDNSFLENRLILPVLGYNRFKFNKKLHKEPSAQKQDQDEGEDKNAAVKDIVKKPPTPEGEEINSTGQDINDSPAKPVAAQKGINRADNLRSNLKKQQKRPWALIENAKSITNKENDEVKSVENPTESNENRAKIAKPHPLADNVDMDFSKPGSNKDSPSQDKKVDNEPNSPAKAEDDLARKESNDAAGNQPKSNTKIDNFYEASRGNLLHDKPDSYIALNAIYVVNRKDDSKNKNLPADDKKELVTLSKKSIQATPNKRTNKNTRATEVDLKSQIQPYYTYLNTLPKTMKKFSPVKTPNEDIQMQMRIFEDEQAERSRPQSTSPDHQHDSNIDNRFPKAKKHTNGIVSSSTFAKTMTNSDVPKALDRESRLRKDSKDQNSKMNDKMAYEAMLSKSKRQPKDVSFAYDDYYDSFDENESDYSAGDYEVGNEKIDSILKSENDQNSNEIKLEYQKLANFNQSMNDPMSKVLELNRHFSSAFPQPWESRDCTDNNSQYINPNPNAAAQKVSNFLDSLSFNSMNNGPVDSPNIKNNLEDPMSNNLNGMRNTLSRQESGSFKYEPFNSSPNNPIADFKKTSDVRSSNQQENNPFNPPNINYHSLGDPFGTRSHVHSTTLNGNKPSGFSTYNYGSLDTSSTKHKTDWKTNSMQNPSTLQENKPSSLSSYEYGSSDTSSNKYGTDSKMNSADLLSTHHDYNPSSFSIYKYGSSDTSSNKYGTDSKTNSADLLSTHHDYCPSSFSIYKYGSSDTSSNKYGTDSKTNSADLLSTHHDYSPSSFSIYKYGSSDTSSNKYGTDSKTNTADLLSTHHDYSPSSFSSNKYDSFDTSPSKYDSNFKSNSIDYTPTQKVYNPLKASTYLYGSSAHDPLKYGLEKKTSLNERLSTQKEDNHLDSLTMNYASFSNDPTKHKSEYKTGFEERSIQPKEFNPLSVSTMNYGSFDNIQLKSKSSLQKNAGRQFVGPQKYVPSNNDPSNKAQTKQEPMSERDPSDERALISNYGLYDFKPKNEWDLKNSLEGHLYVKSQSRAETDKKDRPNTSSNGESNKDDNKKNDEENDGVVEKKNHMKYYPSEKILNRYRAKNAFAFGRDHRQTYFGDTYQGDQRTRSQRYRDVQNEPGESKSTRKVNERPNITPEVSEMIRTAVNNATSTRTLKETFKKLYKTSLCDFD